ncbi:membrane protein [Mycobacterium phage PenguinLover67]|nr:membrane protein [Mycobacterium phage PenguinLover67]
MRAWRAARNIVVGIIFPAAMLVGMTLWRGSYSAELPVYSLGWWLWYLTIISMAILIGVGLYCYWHKTRRPPNGSPSPERPSEPASEE